MQHYIFIVLWAIGIITMHAFSCCGVYKFLNFKNAKYNLIAYILFVLINLLVINYALYFINRG